MKKKPSTSLTHISVFKYLPAEIWTRIFARLPVKTLLCFRCVCKSWCSIIDNPDFINLYYKLCNNNKLSLLLAFEGLGRYGAEGSQLTVRHANTLRKSNHIFKSRDDLKILASCNGLILSCRFGDPPYPKTELRIWNPSIRKSLVIPPCPLPGSLRDMARYVFGFAPCKRDYKVLAIAFERNDNDVLIQSCVAVYTLSDRQWTVKDNAVNARWCFGICFFPPHAIFFQGAAHWIGNDPFGDCSHGVKQLTHLVSLDFDSEKFTHLELPFVLDEKQNLRFVFIIGESLAVLCISSSSAEIWVLDHDNGKRGWKSWFSGSSSSDGFELFKGFGISPVLYYENAGRFLICGKKSYNIVTRQVQDLGKSMSRYVDLVMYLESLVLCKGNGAKDITSFP